MEKRMEFETAEVKLDQLYLDPNNLRFIDFERASKKIPTERIKEESVQKKAFELLRTDEFQVKALRDSIIEVGYLPIDRIVVSSLDNNSFVIIEGNRRIAALKWIDEMIKEGLVNKSVKESYSNIPINILKKEFDTETNRLKIQGIRHISEIRPWGTYQKGVLIKSMIEDEKLTPQDVANAIGYRTQEVNRIYKAYKLLEQMQVDPDYENYAEPELISYFYEAVGRNPLNTLFGYNNKTYLYESEENYHLFYKWIIKDPDNNNIRKIPSANNVRDLTKIIENKEAFSFFKDGTSTIEAALAIALKYTNFDWRKEINQAIEALKKLPMDELENLKEEDIKILSNLKEMIEKRLNNYDKIFGLK